MNSTDQYWMKQINRLKGATIIEAVYDNSFEPVGYGMRIRYPNGKEAVVWLLGDEEGNSTGVISVEDWTPKT